MTPETTTPGTTTPRTTTHDGTGVTLGRAAVVAGLALLGMAILGPFSNFNLMGLVDTADPAATARNLADHEQLLRWATLGFFGMAVLDVVAAWALYVVLAPVNRGVAMLSAWVRVVYACALIASANNLLVALRLIDPSTPHGTFTPEQVDVQILGALNAFTDSWDVSLAVFGLYLPLVGYQVLRSGYAPRTIGVLVMVAGAGYLIDGFGHILVAGYDTKIANVTFVGEVSNVTFFGEVLLMVWLLWKGRRLRLPVAER